MQTVSKANLGPLMAYLVPGMTVLVGFSQFSATLRMWFAASPATAPTIGGFLYLTVVSFATGMTVSAIRWAVIDNLHRFTGLPAPELDFSQLARNVEAFSLLIEIHYQHYLFYGNMTVATAIAYVCYRAKLDMFGLGWLDLGFVLLEAIFFATSRDTMRKYHRRCQQLFA